MFCRSVLPFSLVLGAFSLATGQSQPVPGQSKSLDTHTPAPYVVPSGIPQQPTTPAPPPALKADDLASRSELNAGTKMQLIRILDAEFAHVRKNLPVGDKSIVIGSDGIVRPGDADLFRMAATVGAAAKIGDRVQVTNIAFRDKSVYLEINGGPKKKTKWYQHIQISGMGGATGGVDPNQAQPTGAGFTLEFKKRVPEMTGAELKELLSPVLDFSVKTAAEVFADTLPPKIKEAVKHHEVLVGMNHDMVVMAKDRPPQKNREKDDKGREYEEWIYGKLPEDVVFVRFIGDEVVMVKIAKVSGEMIVKTEKEVEVKDGVPTLAALKASDTPQEVSGKPEPAQPAHRPTLKKPDEQPDPVVQQQQQQQQQPAQSNGQPAHPDEPQWGAKQSPPADDSQQKPPQPDQPKQPPQ